MSVITKGSIAKNFTKSAKRYDEFAWVQKQVAQRLMKRLREAVNTSAFSPKNILEIGCGTGFLSELLLCEFPFSDICFTDISSGMLNICKQKLSQVSAFHGPRKLLFMNMDGERLKPFCTYDLIISNLVFQWFHDVNTAIPAYKEHLKKGGRLFFSTLGQGTLEELQFSLVAAGVSINTLHYITIDELKKSSEGYLLHAYHREREIRYHPDPITFLHTIHGIGARLASSHKPLLNITQMRKVIKALERYRVPGKGIPATYEIIYGMCVK